MQSAHNRLQLCATTPVVTTALLGFFGCVAGLVWRQYRLSGSDLLDSRGWYTPEQASTLFESLNRLDESARAFYAITALSIDMVFPVSYGLLLAILVIRLHPNQALYLFPVALAFADVSENVTVASLALSYKGEPSALAWLAAVFTLIKSVLIVATLLVVAVGVLRWLHTRRKDRR